ncbi:hypothetical protein HOLleu_08573 [Holothuria leucospilota]|uniref:Uncharacterized protein n=1 Tax=Holothuria leucospilota TaxID=206669 RepID=A0A9Q1CHT4_HOLLE|nr:hypothetical protein HOLleu_08573 [Holothuria leucospilota]
MCPPRYCPRPIKLLMECCWRQDPGQRPSFENICDLLASASSSQEVLSTVIPLQGIEIDRGLVSVHSYDHNQEWLETMPMLDPSKYPTRQFSTDSEGYLQATFNPKQEKEKPIRVESIEEQFLKPVEMNIYDSEGPHSPQPCPDNPLDSTQVTLDHEYAFPPVPNGDSERLESLV